MKITKVQIFEYNGTIESFNKMMDNLFGGKYVHIQHLDILGCRTPKFTGSFNVIETGMRYKPGDHYTIDIEEDEIISY